LVCEVVFALLRSDFGEGFGDCCDEGFDGSGGGLSQQGFEFSEELFDRVEVWAVRGQVAQLGAGGFDGFADAGDFVAGEIVHHDDIALAQDRDHELLDIGAKARPIHWSVEHTRRGDLPDTQRGDECRGLPVSPRHAGHQALTARAAAIAARHVGRCAGLVDEDQAFRVQLALARTPLITRLGNI
jgi:hypothetical protein